MRWKDIKLSFWTTLEWNQWDQNINYRFLAFITLYFIWSTSTSKFYISMHSLYFIFENVWIRLKCLWSFAYESKLWMFLKSFWLSLMSTDFFELDWTSNERVKKALIKRVKLLNSPSIMGWCRVWIMFSSCFNEG